METMPTGAVTEILHRLFAIADEEGLARALDSLSPRYHLDAVRHRQPSGVADGGDGA